MLAGKGDAPAGERLPRGRHLAHRNRRNGRSAPSPSAVPIWDPSICIQCNKCALVCPHAAIRAKVYDPDRLAGAPDGFRSSDPCAVKEFAGKSYTIQVAPEDCTGCNLCVVVCPAKDKRQPEAQGPEHGAAFARCVERERAHYSFFLESARGRAQRSRAHRRQDVAASSQPLFEYSGACAGCGETPYVKLLTQLFRRPGAHRQRHRLLVDLRRQPADHAVRTNARRTRPGLVQLAVRGQRRVRPGLPPGRRYAGPRARGRAPAAKLADVGDTLWCASSLQAIQDADADIEEQPATERGRASDCATTLSPSIKDRRRADEDPQELAGSWPTTSCARACGLVGGDGWAYDIGYGGLDHVLGLGT